MSNFYGQYVGFGAGGGSSDPLGGFHGWGYQFGFVHGGPYSSNTIDKISKYCFIIKNYTKLIKRNSKLKTKLISKLIGKKYMPIIKNTGKIT